MPGFFKKDRPASKVSAVIAAAGEARRMEGIDKQLFLLDGVPVVVRSVLAFCESPLVSEVIVVCRREDLADYYRMMQDFALTKVKSVVAGGNSRQESVFSGVVACDSQADYIAVHDGARPLVTREILERCIHSAMEHGAAAVGVPVRDTIKVVGDGGMIAATPPRESLYAVQTPQIFAAQDYRAAMDLAIREHRSYTDDCQLLEHFGKKVYLEEGSYENIKITAQEDLVHAMAILECRERGLPVWE